MKSEKIIFNRAKGGLGGNMNRSKYWTRVGGLTLLKENTKKKGRATISKAQERGIRERKKRSTTYADGLEGGKP